MSKHVHPVDLEQPAGFSVMTAEAVFTQSSAQEEFQAMIAVEHTPTALWFAATSLACNNQLVLIY